MLLGRMRNSPGSVTIQLTKHVVEQTLWFLANDQESQKKLRAEVGPLFAENEHPDYRRLKDLRWLDCVAFVFDWS